MDAAVEKATGIEGPLGSGAAASAHSRVGPGPIAADARFVSTGLRADHRRSAAFRASPPSHTIAHRSGLQYAALDLGTNNCRLLIARPSGPAFRVVDAFSRIVRLGEGLASTGGLSEEAMARALDALKICGDKIAARYVAAGRYVATEACRQADNCALFLARVRAEIGLEIETISSAEEARLVVAGCAPLLNPRIPYAIVFDIGGGDRKSVV